MAFDPALPPFGGYKQSGREFGAHGMSTITEQKSLMMQL
jgi:acyl-CoA reductase-like NAD-dependent aldehyde dehydrogenase